MLTDHDTEMLRARLVPELLHRGGKVRRNGVVEFRCLRHDDKHPSAYMGDHAWGCLSCGFDESLRTLAEALNVLVPTDDYTVEEYATDKGLNLAALLKLGVHSEEQDHHVVLAIPYRTDDGTIVRVKYRHHRKMWWGEHLNGVKGAQIYGLDRLAASDPGSAVLLVEGESDCHACWQEGVLAVGIPGANMWRSEWASYFEGRTVYVWQEPDHGGEQLVEAVTHDLPKARVVRAKGVKDPAELHKQVGERFKEELRRLCVESVPASVKVPDVRYDTMLGENLRKLLVEKLKPISAVPTPWKSWNELCRGAGGRRGIALGWNVIAAATTGAGKSVFAANMAVAAALAGERATYITLEMSQEETMTRTLAIASGLPVQMLEQGPYFSKDAFLEASRRMQEIYEQTGGLVAVNERPIYKLTDILDSIRFNHEFHGGKFFIVDYLQLAWTGNARDLYARIVEVSHSIRGLVKDLKVTHIGLSQFNRETSKEKPSLYGLMGGSSLENDAEQVMLLHPGEYNKETRQQALTAIIAKNRHGPVGDISIKFDTKTLRMTEMLQDEEGSWTIK